MGRLLPKAQRRETVLALKQQSLADKVKAGEQRQVALSKAAKARKSWETAEKSSTEAERLYRNLEGAVAILKERYVSPAQLTGIAKDLEGLEPDRLELAKVEQELASQSEDLACLKEEVTELATADNLAAEALARAEAGLEHVRALHAAGEMRRHLHAGQPCPVCEQVVSAVPKKSAVAAVEQAREDLKKAKAHQERSRKIFQAAEIRLQAIPGQIESTRRHAHALSNGIRKTQSRAEQLLGEPLGDGSHDRLLELAAEFTARETEARQAQTAWEKSRKAAGGAKGLATTADHAADKLRDQLKNLDQARRLEDELLQLDDALAGGGDLGEMEARFKEQQAARSERDEHLNARAQEEARRKQAESEFDRHNTAVAVLAERIRLSEAAIEAAQKEVRKLDQALKKRLEAVELPAGSDEADSLQRLQSAVEKEHRKLTEGHIQRQTRLDQLKKRIVEAEEKRTRLVDLTARQQLHAQIGALLQANQFVRIPSGGGFRAALRGRRPPVDDTQRRALLVRLGERPVLRGGPLERRRAALGEYAQRRRVVSGVPGARAGACRKYCRLSRRSPVHRPGLAVPRRRLLHAGLRDVEYCGGGHRDPASQRPPDRRDLACLGAGRSPARPHPGGEERGREPSGSGRSGCHYQRLMSEVGQSTAY